MSKLFEIYVFGQDFDNVESIGGWQRVFGSFDEDRANQVYCEWVAKIGEENVDRNF